MRTTLLSFAIAFAAVLGAACGSNNNGGSNTQPDSGTPPPSGPTITIQNYAYSPAELTVDAGAVIGIINMDDMAHTVTSESADNAFTPGAVAGVSFDTGMVAPGTGTGGGGGGYGRAATGGVTITIPANAPSGTVIPYYCTVHTSTMATPNGHITVR